MGRGRGGSGAAGNPQGGHGDGGSREGGVREKVEQYVSRYDLDYTEGKVMRIEKIDLGEMHSIAKAAVKKMRDIADKAGDSLDNFSECQLEHEIGFALNQRKIITYFDYRYPENKEKSKPRTDILAWGHGYNLKAKGGHHIWIEIKFTCHTRHNLSQLGWRRDFDKLRQPHYPQWSGRHYAYWIWLYIFDNLQTQLRDKFGEIDSWTNRKDLKQMSELFESKKKPRRLGEILQDISGNCIEATCSIMPCVTPGQSSSALLVTAALRC